MAQKGSASYTINYPVAWDKIVCIPEDEIMVKKADALVFGSLVCRDSISQNSLLEIINYAKYAVFDVDFAKTAVALKVAVEVYEAVVVADAG